MKQIYQDIIQANLKGKKLLAALLDPDKMGLHKVPSFLEKVNASNVTHLFVGGSTVVDDATEALVSKLKEHTTLPVILFPGDVTQITEKADALLFLSLISGRNPEYLIGKHIKASSILMETTLEIIPTGYMLIENGKETAVERVTQTQPLSRKDIPLIVNTAKAGELLGMKLIYLEAGSGATHSVSYELISAVKQAIDIPLIVGGGIRSSEQLNDAYKAGADLVVIGTAFEEDESLLNQL